MYVCGSCLISLLKIVISLTDRERHVCEKWNGELPYEDVVLDFSNPETVKWYQGQTGGIAEYRCQCH